MTADKASTTTAIESASISFTGIKPSEKTTATAPNMTAKEKAKQNDDGKSCTEKNLERLLVQAKQKQEDMNTPRIFLRVGSI